MYYMVLGDKSRYQFLRGIIETGYNSRNYFSDVKLGENDICISSDKCEEDMVYYSRKIPLNTKLFFPNAYGELSKEYEDYKKYDKIIVFDEFPYATSDIIKDVDTLIKLVGNVKLLVVIFRNGIEGLKSDVSTEDDAFLNAKRIYESKEICIHSYSPNESAGFLFRTIKNIDNCGFTIMQEIVKVRGNLITLDSFFDLIFEEYMKSYIDIDILNRFIKLSNIKNRENIWEIYSKTAYDYYWIKNEHEIRKYYLMLYAKVVAGLRIWNTENDEDKLLDILKSEFLKQFDDFDEVIFNKNMDLNELFLKAHEQEIIRFKEKIIYYFKNEAKNIIKQYVVELMDKIERLLK